MDVKERALEAHEKWAGKIEVVARCEVNSKDDLSIAYTPGVAEPCLKIKDDPTLSYKYTRRHNLVAVITDGTAVLGLGDIGPLAGMPVMEGKCALFKAFADVDAFPLCVASKDVDEIVRTVQLISGSFGGINLEDIAAPRCFEIERRLKEVCDIPVFHDDQHGTAVCCGAALLNACRLTGRKVDEIKMVVNGCGAAAIAVTKFLMFLGVKDITMVERFGIVCEGDERLNPAQAEMAKVTNRSRMTGTLADAVKGADVFFGMSAGADHRDGLHYGKGPDGVRNGEPGAGNLAGGRKEGRRGCCRHRPFGLPEPDQQRACLPGHLPRRARCPRKRHQRGDEARGGESHRFLRIRRGAERRVHHADGVR